MPNLTDADKKAFIGDMIASLGGNKDLLLAGQPEVPGSGWDPTQRIAALEGAQDTVDGHEKTIASLETALKTAIDARRAALERTYDIASASVSSAEGAVGKEHPLVKQLRQLRGSYSHAPAEPEDKPQP
jgi:hypothetical protein